MSEPSADWGSQMDSVGGNLFLGGRYFADYYYLTCSLMHFCCSQEDSPPTVETNYENGNSFKWEFKNQHQTVLGQRYENCWESTKVRVSNRVS